jgi:hypothetical protein
MPHLVKRCMGSYRLHKESKTVSQWDAFQPEFERTRAEYWPMLTAKQRRRAKLLRRKREGDQHRVLAWQALSRSNVAEARKHAFEAFRNAKLAFSSWRIMYCALRGH